LPFLGRAALLRAGARAAGPANTSGGVTALRSRRMYEAVSARHNLFQFIVAVSLDRIHPKSWLITTTLRLGVPAS
jgi:hypothetical protein